MLVRRSNKEARVGPLNYIYKHSPFVTNKGTHYIIESHCLNLGIGFCNRKWSESISLLYISIFIYLNIYLHNSWRSSK